MRIRPATTADAAALAAIYGHHVLHGFGTFEEIAPSMEEVGRRLAAVLSHGLPYLVAEIDGAVAGFAYASPFRTRAAYRYTVEDSVYIAPDRLGQGIGKALLTAVIGEAEALGLRQMVAMIGDSGNAGSVGLHRACGFESSGVLRGLGFKAGRWVDVVTMQRVLNSGVAEAPETPGIDWGGN
ncbi:MAG TPA: GNAT family N-acetyltransferase [Caulobacteraceae bacterium]|nr:GNAT family N-acetyltransferase [Caulobacteraceae bacterium]